MSMEVCGHVYDDFICGMPQSFGDHDPDVREFGGHEYEPVLIVPLPLDYEAAEAAYSEGLDATALADRMVDAALGLA